MGNSSINTTENPKKFKFSASAAWIISAIAILAVCLIFFIATLLALTGTQAEPSIFDLSGIGATNDSLLISWNCTSAADEYIISCTGPNGETDDLTTDITFASISGLKPDSTYTVEVVPVKNGQKYSARSVQCTTEPYCEITSITVNECTSNSVTVSWQYNGKNEGFTAIAYVADIGGKRHLTSAKVDVAADSDTKCTISGLMPEMYYTVAIMPKSRFKKIGKLNFETQNNSISYKKLSIIRAAICPDDTQYTKNITKLTSVTPGKPYKISMMIIGEATSQDKVNMALYIKNSSGQLVSETNYPNIYTNPDEVSAGMQRIILLDFTAPQQQDEYTAYLTFDGELVRRIDFDTFAE